MKAENDPDDVLEAWGRAERVRREERRRDAILDETLAWQARRRRGRRAGWVAAVAILVGLSFIAGRASVSSSGSGVAPAEAVSPVLSDDGARASTTPPLVLAETPTTDIDPLSRELEAYLMTGEERRTEYATAAQDWLEEEADVLASIRCLERLEGDGAPDPDDLRWNNWLFVALQRDAQ